MKAKLNIQSKHHREGEF